MFVFTSKNLQKKMSVKVEKITECLSLGEGPHWDDSQQALFFINVVDKTINKYVPAIKEYAKTTLDGTVGFIVPVDGTTDQFVVGLERKFVIVQWDGKNGSPAKVVKEIAEVDQDFPKNRINDGKADPKGRIYAGTLDSEHPMANTDGKGSVYRIDRGTITKLDDKIHVANGLAWDLKEKAFYYIDSWEHKVRRYDYDVETGDISNKKYVFDLKKNNVEGIPDGMTIDTNGNLWVALWGGNAIVNIDPRTGKLLQKISIPSNQVTSVTFGGPNLDIMFVTTANISLKKGEDKHPSPNGATFMVTGAGVKGLPNIHYKP